MQIGHFLRFETKPKTSAYSMHMHTVILISLAFTLTACVGFVNEYHLCRNIVFTANVEHVFNNLSYGDEIGKGVILFSHGVDLVVTSDRLAIVRQMNTKDSYADSEFDPQFNSLIESKVSYLYWIILLDKVPAHLRENEHGERVREFTMGPFLESEAIEALANYNFDKGKRVVRYLCKGRFVPRWMYVEDGEYFDHPHTVLTFREWCGELRKFLAW